MSQTNNKCIFCSYERSGGGLYLGTCIPATSKCNAVGTLRQGDPCVCKENVEGEQ